ATLLPGHRRFPLAPHLDGDDLRGADPLALQAADAGLVAVLLVKQGEARAIALGTRADDLRELHRDRLAEEVAEAGRQRASGGREVAAHRNTTHAADAPTRSTPAGTSTFQQSCIS